MVWKLSITQRLRVPFMGIYSEPNTSSTEKANLQGKQRRNRYSNNSRNEVTGSPWSERLSKS